MIQIDRDSKSLLIEDSMAYKGGAFIKLDGGTSIHIPAGTRFEAAKELAGEGVLVVELPQFEEHFVESLMKWGPVQINGAEGHHLAQIAAFREARRRLEEQPKRDEVQMRLIVEGLAANIHPDHQEGLAEALYDRGFRVNA